MSPDPTAFRLRCTFQNVNFSILHSFPIEGPSSERGGVDFAVDSGVRISLWTVCPRAWALWEHSFRLGSASCVRTRNMIQSLSLCRRAWAQLCLQWEHSFRLRAGVIHSGYGGCRGLWREEGEDLWREGGLGREGGEGRLWREEGEGGLWRLIIKNSE
jgi:hypothetical protein